MIRRRPTPGAAPTRSRCATGAKLFASVLAATVALWAAGCSGGSEEGGSTSTTTTAPPVEEPEGLPASAVEAGLRTVQVGQCFVLPEDDPAAEDRAVWVVPCEEPHSHEVYDVIAYDGPMVRGGGYPGAAPVQDWAEQVCFDRFEVFVGIPWTRSDMDIEVWWPSEDSWGRTDRSVICTVFPATGGTVTGTARDSRA